MVQQRIKLTRSSNRNHHHHHQRQASAGVGAGAQLLVVVVLDLRMVVVEVSGTCYLLPGMRQNTYVPGTFACFSQDDPWYLVSRPFNITKLRELGTALNTTSRGGWRCYLATFRNAVRFEIGGVVVAHVTEGDVRIISHEYQSEIQRYNLSKEYK